uniref:Uncharacterized protein n=1 Tax=Magallana gigas TaxID=29159 RepID=A0A8W8MJ65_MAGGI
MLEAKSNTITPDVWGNRRIYEFAPFNFDGFCDKCHQSSVGPPPPPGLGHQDPLQKVGPDQEEEERGHCPQRDRWKWREDSRKWREEDSHSHHRRWVPHPVRHPAPHHPRWVPHPVRHPAPLIQWPPHHRQPGVVGDTTSVLLRGLERVPKSLHHANIFTEAKRMVGEQLISNFSKRRQCTLQCEGRTALLTLWGQKSDDDIIPGLYEVYAVRPTNDFNGQRSYNSTPSTAFKTVEEDAPVPFEGEITSVCFESNLVEMQDTLYSVSRHHLETLFPGNQFREGVKVIGRRRLSFVEEISQVS